MILTHSLPVSDHLLPGVLQIPESQNIMKIYFPLVLSTLKHLWCDAIHIKLAPTFVNHAIMSL